MSESQQYETVWTGASWRAVPQPSAHPEPVAIYRPEPVPVTFSDRIEAALNDDWSRCVDIARRAGVGFGGDVSVVVKRLVDAGRAERTPAPRPYRGRPGFLYRRAPRQGAA